MQFSQAYDSFQEIGADIWAISPQSAAINHALAVRRSILFPILADEQQTVIRAWGVFDERDSQARAIPYPALYVMAENGRVYWRHIGRTTRDRPTVAQVRAVMLELTTGNRRQEGNK